MFTKLEEYNTFWAAIKCLYNTSMGDWDLRMYEDIEYQWVGEVFHIFFIFLNMLMLMNLVIAMMSDTYALYNSEKIGLYFSVII